MIVKSAGRVLSGISSWVSRTGAGPVAARMAVAQLYREIGLGQATSLPMDRAYRIMRNWGLDIRRREVRGIARKVKSEFRQVARQRERSLYRRVPADQFAVKTNPYGEPVNWRNRYNYVYRAEYTVPETYEIRTRYYTWGDPERLSPSGAANRMRRYWMTYLDPETVDRLGGGRLEFVGAYRRT